MKVNIHTDGVIITSKQKSLIEKKVSKLKKYINEEPSTIDVMLRDLTGSEKGGVDQAVHINVTFGKEKIFIEEVDDRLMRAFALAFQRCERQLSRMHEKRISSERQGGGRIEKLWGVIKRKR